MGTTSKPTNEQTMIVALNAEGFIKGSNKLKKKSSTIVLNRNGVLQRFWIAGEFIPWENNPSISEIVRRMKNDLHSRSKYMNI